MSSERYREKQAIQKILTEVDTLLRERLKAAGLDIRHVLLAAAPGAAVLRTNVEPAGLDDMAILLALIATNAPADEPLN